MAPARSGGELRQIVLRVPAGSEEYGDDSDELGAIGDQPIDRAAKRRLHELEVREADRRVGLGGKLGGELLERPRPLAVTRAVREKNEAFQ